MLLLRTDLVHTSSNYVGRIERQKGIARLRKWLSLVFLILVVSLGLVQYGPYPFTVPKALLTIMTNKAWLVPLNTDATKMVGRRRIADRELTKYLEQRGWVHKETKEDPTCSLACSETLIYQQDEVTLTVQGKFRRGFWWYELDRAPAPR